MTWVPLVYYTGRARIVIGRAEMDDDGTIQAEINDPVIKNYMNEKMLPAMSFSVDEDAVFPRIQRGIWDRNAPLDKFLKGED